MNCAALGCGKGAGNGRWFCLGHWRKIPTEMRDSKKIAQARTYLGRLDGYLAEVPVKRVVLTDVPGTDDI